MLEAAIPVGRFELTLTDFMPTVVAVAEKRLGPEAQDEDAFTVFVRHLRLDDLYLAQACAGGEEAAWEEFHRTYFDFIKEFARHSAAGAAEAEDLAQQMLTDLWQRGKIGRYEGMSSLRTWLGTLIARASINAIRCRRSMLSIESDVQEDVYQRPAVGLDDDASSRRLVVETVKQVVECLPSKDKLLLLLYYEQGLTLREMTATYRLTEATLSRQLKGLRQRIRDQLESELEGRRGLSMATAQDLLANLPADLDLDLRNVLKA